MQQLKTVRPGAQLTVEGASCPGNIYFLLRGGINAMITGGKKLIDTYRPVVQFVDSPYALQPDVPGEKEAARKLRVQRSSRADKTLVSVAAGEIALSRTLCVSSFPADTTAEQLRDKFAEFGTNTETCISSVQVWRTSLGSSGEEVAQAAAATKLQAHQRGKLVMPDKKGRAALFREIDNNGNGGLSLAEIDKAVVDGQIGRALGCADFNHKPALMRAYKAADTSGDGFIERREFFKLLKYV